MWVSLLFLLLVFGDAFVSTVFKTLWITITQYYRSRDPSSSLHDQIPISGGKFQGISFSPLEKPQFWEHDTGTLFLLLNSFYLPLKHSAWVRKYIQGVRQLLHPGLPYGGQEPQPLSCYLAPSIHICRKVQWEQRWDSMAGALLEEERVPSCTRLQAQDGPAVYSIFLVLSKRLHLHFAQVPPTPCKKINLKPNLFLV